MENESVIFLFSIIYTICCVWQIYKRGVNIGSVILLMYTFCLWGSYMYYQTGAVFMFNFNDRMTLSIEGFSYITIVLFIFIYPFCRFRIDKYKYIEIIEKQSLLRVVRILFILEIILLIMFLPSIISAMSGDLGSNRDMIYEGESFIKVKNPTIIYIMRLLGGVQHIGIAIALYAFFFYKEEKIVRFFLFLSVLYPIMMSLLWIMRSQILLIMFFLLYLMFFFKHFFSTGLWKKTIAWLSVSGIGGFAIIQAISVSRFGNSVWIFFYRYWGEAFLNFDNLLYKKIHNFTWGHAYFPTIFKLVGLKGVSGNDEKYALIDKVCGIDGSIFYTFIGGLCIEFGFVITFFIACFFLLYNNKILNHSSNVLRLPCILIIAYWGWQFLQGLFTAAFQGDSGNWEIIETILLCIYFHMSPKKILPISNYQKI